MSPLHGVARAAQLDHTSTESIAAALAPVRRFSQSLELEHLGVRQSPFATFIDYRVKK